VTGTSGTGRAQRRQCLPCEPPGGDEVRQGAAAVRARCRADGGQERGPAAQACAGAVQWRRCFSRCIDRSAGGCADRPTVATARARACGDLDCDFARDMYQMTLCEAGEAADCVTWVGMPACLLGTALSFFGSFGFTSRYRRFSQRLQNPPVLTADTSSSILES
jgi:hypothetical protein